MRRSKSKLSFLKWIFFLGIILFLSYIRTTTRKFTDLEEEVTLTGIVTKIVKKEEGTTLEVKNKERFLVYTNQKRTLQLGDQVRITGTKSRIKESGVFHLFRYDLYMKSKKITYQIVSSDMKVIGHGSNIFLNIKHKFINYVDRYPNSSYFKSLLLGEGFRMEPKIKEQSQSLGISHLFALSGMHVSILSGILLKFFSLFTKKTNAKKLVSCFLIFYLFLTGFPPSLIRASILSILFFTSIPYSKRSILCILFGVFLLYNPYYLYHPGFLYSFTISFFLFSFSSVIQSKKNYISRLFLVNFIATLSSIPITLYFFFEINLSSFFFNLLFVPFFSFFFFPLTIFTFCFPFFHPIYSFFVLLFEKTIFFCDRFSLDLTLPRISLFYYFFYEILFYLFLSCKKKRILFLFFLCLWLHYHWFFFFGRTFLTILNVDQGDCIFLSLKQNKESILIDTGGTFSYDQKKTYDYTSKRIIPYLKSRGIRRLNTLILTHGDYDHMGEAINLVENFKVEKVIFNCGEYNELEKELIKVLDKKKIPYYSCIKELNIDDNRLYFLNNNDYGNENDNSSVIYTELNGYKFMFMGDAGVTTEKEIFNKYNLSDIDVLKVGHHGSKTSSGKEFINEVNPKYSIISVGKNNRYGHPNKEVLNNLANSKIYRTDEDGSIMFKIKNSKLKIETCSP